MKTRFHNPYHYWARGLLTEIVVLSLFIVVLALLGAVVVWLG